MQYQGSMIIRQDQGTKSEESALSRLIREACLGKIPFEKRSKGNERVSSTVKT